MPIPNDIFVRLIRPLRKGHLLCTLYYLCLSTDNTQLVALCRQPQNQLAAATTHTVSKPIINRRLSHYITFSFNFFASRCTWDYSRLPLYPRNGTPISSHAGGWIIRLLILLGRMGKDGLEDNLIKVYDDVFFQVQVHVFISL